MLAPMPAARRATEERRLRAPETDSESVSGTSTLIHSPRRTTEPAAPRNQHRRPSYLTQEAGFRALSGLETAETSSGIPRRSRNTRAGAPGLLEPHSGVTCDEISCAIHRAPDPGKAAPSQVGIVRHDLGTGSGVPVTKLLTKPGWLECGPRSGRQEPRSSCLESRILARRKVEQAKPEPIMNISRGRGPPARRHALLTLCVRGKPHLAHALCLDAHAYVCTQ